MSRVFLHEGRKKDPPSRGAVDLSVRTFGVPRWVGLFPDGQPSAALFTCPPPPPTGVPHACPVHSGALTSV